MGQIPESTYLTGMRFPALEITYVFIERFVAQYGFRPTIFQIARGLNIAYGVARAQVILMELRGWIYRDKRSIELRGISQPGRRIKHNV